METNFPQCHVLLAEKAWEGQYEATDIGLDRKGDQDNVFPLEADLHSPTRSLLQQLGSHLESLENIATAQLKGMEEAMEKTRSKVDMALHQKLLHETYEGSVANF